MAFVFSHSAKLLFIQEQTVKQKLISLAEVTLAMCWLQFFLAALAEVSVKLIVCSLVLKVSLVNHVFVFLGQKVCDTY